MLKSYEKLEKNDINYLDTCFNTVMNENSNQILYVDNEDELLEVDYKYYIEKY